MVINTYKKRLKQKSCLFSKTILSFFLKHGSVVTAERNFKLLFKLLFKKTKFGQCSLLTKIFKKLFFFFEIKKIEKRRKSHFVPIPVTKTRRIFIITKWLFESAKEDKKKNSFVIKLSEEILKYFNKKDSLSLKKKKKTESLVFQMRSNSHFRWY